MDNYVIKTNPSNSNKSNKERTKVKIPKAKGMTLHKFEYDINDNDKKKNNNFSFKTYAQALKTLGIFPTEITDESIFYGESSVIIWRNFCLDGLYFHQLRKNVELIMDNLDKLSMVTKYAIDGFVQLYFNTTIFLKPCEHDPLHGNELDAKAAKLIVYTLKTCTKLLKKCMFCNI